ncbi:MAG: hypothetical protein P9L88_05015 [Candidatus Tantalella remota]|nr:hypothetical protein [Candidatus Tantalella remota]
MKIRLLLILGLSFFVAGCLLTRADSYSFGPKYILYDQYSIVIKSDPSDVRVEWNGKTIGDTPVSKIVDERRTFYAPDIIVKAYSPEGGVMTKVLRADQPLPKEINFSFESDSKEKENSKNGS